ncbi:MAG: adenylosuccinate synthetase, partial [Candidatus Saccharimonadales bacterium]
DKLNVIAHGVLLDPVRLVREIKDARSKGLHVSPTNLVISDMAHIVLPKHKSQDTARELTNKAQGSTKAGIAYAASDKSLRIGVRVDAIRTKTKEELHQIAVAGLISDNAEQRAAKFADAAVQLQPYIQDTPAILNNLLDDGKNVLVEGAQAFGLDINHGKYPYTTSTGTTVPALIEGTGINPKRAGRVVGVVKATPSKVGGGSFVSKIEDDAVAETTRGKKGEVDGEYGATTGRQREVGYLDLVQLKRAIQINGVDDIALTKFDCIKRHGPSTKIAVAYQCDGQELLVPPNSDDDLAQCQPVYKTFPTWEDDASSEAQDYLAFIEDYLGTPVSIVGNGPGRDQVILR